MLVNLSLKNLYNSVITEKMGVLKIVLLLTVATVTASLIGINILEGETSTTEKLGKDKIPKIDEKQPKETKTATLALGCFWGPDAKFGAVPGVIKTQVGYSGGEKENPTYHDLGNHTETVQIEYDPKKVTYRELLEIFWNSHNPTSYTTKQYMSIIFTHNENQEKIAHETKIEEEQNGKNLVTEIKPFKKFYPAEDYHQKYHLRQNDKIFQIYDHI